MTSVTSGHLRPWTDAQARRHGYRRGVLPLRRLALPVLLAAASVAVAGPASADVTGTTTVPDVVLYDHCQQVPVSYQLQVAGLPVPWVVEFQIADPQGFVSQGVVVNSASNPSTSGTFNYQFCGSEEPGTYTVLGGVRYSPIDVFSANLPPTTFEVRPAATRTTAARQALGHGHYRVTTRVREQDEHGFVRGNGITVRIERLAHGEWKTLRGSTLTTIHGTVTTTLVARPGTRVRAVVPARHNYAGSVSRPIRL